MAEAKVDADAFNVFEASGWEKQAAGYEDFFGPITTQSVDARCSRNQQCRVGDRLDGLRKPDRRRPS